MGRSLVFKDVGNHGLGVHAVWNLGLEAYEL